MFELLKTEGKARRGVFTCAHGTVQTPVFMNIGTAKDILLSKDYLPANPKAWPKNKDMLPCILKVKK